MKCYKFITVCMCLVQFIDCPRCTLELALQIRDINASGPGRECSRRKAVSPTTGALTARRACGCVLSANLYFS
jgi:hypothetical protein